MSNISVRWRGFDKSELTGWVTSIGGDLRETMERIAVEVAAEAAEDMIRILEAAVTDTGLARVEAGGNGPGRVDSGTMRDAISSKILESERDRVVVGWGWLDEVLDYFLYQEYGPEKYDVNFEAMSALQVSFTKAREEFRRRLSRLGQEI